MLSENVMLCDLKINFVVAEQLCRVVRLFSQTTIFGFDVIEVRLKED